MESLRPCLSGLCCRLWFISCFKFGRHINSNGYFIFSSDKPFCLTMAGKKPELHSSTDCRLSFFAFIEQCETFFFRSSIDQSLCSSYTTWYKQMIRSRSGESKLLLPFYIVTRGCGQEKTIFSKEIYSLFLCFTYWKCAEHCGNCKTRQYVVKIKLDSAIMYMLRW